MLGPAIRSGIAHRWLAIALVALAGCQPPAGDQESRRGSGRGPGGREQPLALSPREELATGRQAYREVLDEFRGHIVPESHPDTVRAKRVVARLIKATEIEPLQREMNLRIQGYTFEWAETVVQERQVNAFCLPAGKMVVFTGIMPVANTDGELAAVLSHEMAHALAHHASERVAREQSGGNPLTKLKYDRFQESEADHIGVFLMAFADFNPEEAVAFWLRMRRMASGGQPPEILSDHPSNETRIRNLRRWARARRPPERRTTKDA